MNSPNSVNVQIGRTTLAKSSLHRSLLISIRTNFVEPLGIGGVINTSECPLKTTGSISGVHNINLSTDLVVATHMSEKRSIKKIIRMDSRDVTADQRVVGLNDVPVDVERRAAGVDAQCRKATSRDHVGFVVLLSGEELGSAQLRTTLSVMLGMSVCRRALMMNN